MNNNIEMIVETNNNDINFQIEKTGGTSNYEQLSNKPQINGVELSGNKTTSELGIEIPDVSNFITRSVDDLVNYYTKSETYTQSEVDNLIGDISNFHYQVVRELPLVGEDNILYLLPKSQTRGVNNYYDEYVYANGDYELIGDTQIDLSDYATIDYVDGLVGNINSVLATLTTISGGE